ncbi:hypothetical protein SKAU_G00188090 [Synaphobranchus kaupii]|uniref:Uncharacterized protein n=1 Tax=Synaphobranchus kaupii TaxID=118154 RepID=A0A9Q1FDE9_SYNKA|nr:hypothetical protein SKAU_G00188090 [Synaphobranchus kaupii]
MGPGPVPQAEPRQMGSRLPRSPREGTGGPRALALLTPVTDGQGQRHYLLSASPQRKRRFHENRRAVRAARPKTNTQDGAAAAAHVKTLRRLTGRHPEINRPPVHRGPRRAAVPQTTREKSRVDVRPAPAAPPLRGAPQLDSCSHPLDLF